MEHERETTTGTDLRRQRLRDRVDQQRVLGHRIGVSAHSLAIPACDTRQAVGNVLDLDIKRRRIGEIEPPTRDHALPGTGVRRLFGHPDRFQRDLEARRRSPMPAARVRECDALAAMAVPRPSLASAVEADEGETGRSDGRSEDAQGPPGRGYSRAAEGRSAFLLTITNRRRAVPRCSMRDTTSWPT